MENWHHFLPSALHAFTACQVTCSVFRRTQRTREKHANNSQKVNGTCDKEWRCSICKGLLQINKKKPSHPKEYIRASRNKIGQYKI